jgi:hypothetical protein
MNTKGKESGKEEKAWQICRLEENIAQIDEKNKEKKPLDKEYNFTGNKEERERETSLDKDIIVQKDREQLLKWKKKRKKEREPNMNLEDTKLIEQYTMDQKRKNSNIIRKDRINFID